MQAVSHLGSLGLSRWCPTLYSADQLRRHLGDAALDELLDFVEDRPDGLDALAGGLEVPVEVEAVRVPSRLQVRDASHREMSDDTEYRSGVG